MFKDVYLVIADGYAKLAELIERDMFQLPGITHPSGR
jgi:hypothetical protein